MTTQITKAMGEVVAVLDPFSREERLRIVRASLTLLGDDPGNLQPPGKQAGHAVEPDGPEVREGISAAASSLLKKQGVALEQLEHYFHFDHGKVTLLAIPASITSKREQTCATYLFLGFAQYLESGDSSFDDSAARNHCVTFGCYDGPNHSKAISAMGNKLTGNKKSGWKVTNPGLNAAAQMIKS